MHRPDLQAWQAYFDANASRPDTVPWDAPDLLDVDEKNCIAASIATFQLGEYAEGASLLAFATAFGEQLGEDRLVAITRRFIKEEQGHALMLKRFMEAHGIATLKHEWTNSVFRRLRKKAGYEISVTVLITAELISLVYYQALRASTGSPVLGAICTRILREEAAHVRYESQLLRFIRERREGLVRHVPDLLHGILLAGTVLVVYREHRRVLHRGGYGLVRFWRECWAVHRQHLGAKREVQERQHGAIDFEVE